MTSASHRQRRMGIIDALDQEWRELVNGRSDAVIRWAERHTVLTPCQSLDDVLAVASLNTDPVLAALLTEVSAGDQLAGRVVLQTMLGRMVRMAQRDPRSSVDDYLTWLWCVINGYPLDRRPVRIAANLSMDTMNSVWRDRTWLARGEITVGLSGEALEELLQPAGLDGSSGDASPPIDVEVHRVLEAGSLLRLIDDSDAALLRGVYADGMTGDQAARRFHTSAGVVRVRCSKAVRRLAAHAVELANAA
jgi:hypothetical protein